MVTQFTQKSHRRWDKHLAELRFAYNAARHEATGYSPAYLNHERELALLHPEDRRHTDALPPHQLKRHLEDVFKVVRITRACTF